MNQRQRRARIAAVLIVQRAQRRERRLLLARQDVADVRGFGEPLVRHPKCFDFTIVGEAA